MGTSLLEHILLTSYFSASVSNTAVEIPVMLLRVWKVRSLNISGYRNSKLRNFMIILSLSSRMVVQYAKLKTGHDHFIKCPL